MEVRLHLGLQDLELGFLEELEVERGSRDLRVERVERVARGGAPPLLLVAVDPAAPLVLRRGGIESEAGRRVGGRVGAAAWSGNGLCVGVHASICVRVFVCVRLFCVQICCCGSLEEMRAGCVHTCNCCCFLYEQGV